jgi:Zn-dependent protease
MNPGIFSRKEVKDIALSVLALSFVFAYSEVILQPVFILFSLFAVGIAFMGHELSHRFVARRLGYWAEYRIWNQGIVLALLMAIATNGGFIFAAPGAVVFSSLWAFRNPTLRDVGRIGIAGVAFNLALMFSLLGVYLIFPVSILIFAATINAWLAIFNLIPFGPLDGQKVLKWDWRVWGAAMGMSVAGFAFAILL